MIKNQTVGKRKRKREKPRKGWRLVKGKHDEQDYISKLPDDILVSVLSLLDMKTAGRTSVLARRWRYLCSQLLVLDFDDTDLLYDLSMNTSKWSDHLFDNYRDWVNQVVALHSATIITTFKVHFPLDNVHEDDITKWIVFALSKQVAHLEVNLSYSSPARLFPCYTLPFMTPSLLRLFGATFLDPYLSPTNYNDTLRSLHLESLDIHSFLLECVLCNCRNLERLIVRMCGALYTTKLVVSSTALKYLELYNYYGINTVEICAPKLASLVLFTKLITVDYQCVPSLIEVTFGFCLSPHDVIKKMQPLSPFASQLNKLSFTFYLSLCFASTPLSDAFSNLKLLELSVNPTPANNLLALVSFLGAFPRLEKLKLKLPPVINSLMEPVSVSKEEMINAMRAHQHLEVVEFVSLFDGASSVELALCLMEHLLMLKQIIFDPRRPQLMGEPVRPFGNGCAEILARKQAEMLAQQIKEGVDVVIL